MNILEISKKIESNIEVTKRGLFEREEIIKLSYLALLSGESIFMLGLPGVAKSLIARRMKYAMDGERHFEYLMNKFSTPEEIFGPISIKELENDNYVRKIDGYLPSSEVVFLDEIWKASPAIQNTLLTIINEKIFRNGTEDISVPLKLLISASNELPQEGEGLEALYDRFLIRYIVKPASTREAFENIIDSKQENEFNPNDLHKITEKDIDGVKKGIQGVETTDEVFNFINEFQKKLDVELGEKKPYISDRRWKKILNMIKINALISGRQKTALSDLFVIKHCAWESQASFKQIENIFNSCFVDVIAERIGSSFSEISAMLQKARKLFKEAYQNTREHTSVKHNGQTYYKFIYAKQTVVWIPTDENYRVSSTFTIYYQNIGDNRDISQCSGENWSAGNFSMGKSGNGTHGEYPLQGELKGVIKKNNGKLHEAVLDINEAITMNSRLEDKVKDEINRLKNEKSLFSFEMEYAFEKSQAIIIDGCKEMNKGFTELLGKIESAKNS